MNPNRWLIGIVFGIMMVSMIVTPSVMAAENDGSKKISPKLQTFEIDAFTYRISFQLSDGIEIFLLRCSFKTLYLYQHHHPTVSKHYFQSYVGFYFGKSPLGRSLVSSIDVTNLAFYPQWIDSRGDPHNMLGETPAFAINGKIRDGQLSGNFQLIDPYASSRYLLQFGGTFEFKGLVITLAEGTKYNLTENTIHIEIVKEFNEYNPNEPDIASGNIAHDSFANYAYLTIEGPTPLLQLLDLVVLISAVSLVLVSISLFILWFKGRIDLPMLKRVASPSQQ
ncbi:MAG: hypothetical protein GF411_04965 [Candidatus Lokiarchaeota archaeon]|nr:hypothetical protein [Candidatus Lokiarchaeota archaeon]